MKSLYTVNSLVIWEEKDIRLKRFFENTIKEEVKSILIKENPQWKFFQIEAPSLIPVDLISSNYTSDDVWMQERKYDSEVQLVLKPETTPSSYIYAEHMLDNHLVLPPFVIWQTSKSFRREQDQPIKHMRLKEFSQTEFQCIYSADTLNDYQEAVLEPLRKMFQDMIALPTRIVESDRLPDYSLRTMDIEVWNEDKWMELCSISKRKDFTKKAVFTHKNKVIEKDLLVLEIATSVDRILYNYSIRTEKNLDSN
jgi:glycyl-tRNA synthetase